MTLKKMALLSLLLVTNIAFAQMKLSDYYKFSADTYNAIQKDSNLWRGGITSSDLSFIGLYKEALVEYDKPRQDKKTISSADSLLFVKKYHPVDAKAFILQKAKENQIVIFNEAHYNPRNRVFVTSLLADLKKAGYKYFAAETFSEERVFRNAEHPGILTGYYSVEPQFGNLVRAATKLDYILYPYEDTSRVYNAKQREIGEATNLATLLKKDPGAKIIVYCGFNHIYEDAVVNWGKAMAGHLKEFTGIDPYTIDQVDLSEKSETALEAPEYRIIQSAFHPAAYTIMVDESGKPFTNHRVDALLYTPPTVYQYNRPGWIFENDKKPYFLDATKIEISFPIIVKAYPATDDIQTKVPVDIIEIKSKADVANTALALAKQGLFIITITNKENKTQQFTIGK
ncbi:MAG: hypothetical protein J0I41_22155 [Filimonas sp.]|nr:hypothetical protein [Filimonas sp.]